MKFVMSIYIGGEKNRSPLLSGRVSALSCPGPRLTVRWRLNTRLGA